MVEQGSDQRWVELNTLQSKKALPELSAWCFSLAVMNAMNNIEMLSQRAEVVSSSLEVMISAAWPPDLSI